MKSKITKEEFIKAESKMEQLLAIATKKGGFNFLSEKETKQLASQTQIVKFYEEQNIQIPMPDSLKGIIELKMYEKKLKQKDLAEMLHTSTTQLSEILNNKRKPTLNFLKSMHQILGIDGNLLLRVV